MHLEESLELRRREGALGNMLRELGRKVVEGFHINVRGGAPSISRKHPHEHLHCRLPTNISQVHLEVNPPRSHQSRIKQLRFVSGHDDNPPLLRPDTVQDIQQSRQRAVRPRTVATARPDRPVLPVGQVPVASPHRVDVLEQHDALGRDLLEHLLQVRVGGNAGDLDLVEVEAELAR